MFLIYHDKIMGTHPPVAPSKRQHAGFDPAQATDEESDWSNCFMIQGLSKSPRNSWLQ